MTSIDRPIVTRLLSNEQITLTLTAFALVGVAVSPLLGNAAALMIGLPRRPIQVMLLLAFGALLVNAGLGLSGWKALREGFAMGRMLGAGLAALGVVALRVAGALWGGQRPSLYALAAAALSICWLALLMYHLTERAKTSSNWADRTYPLAFQRAVVALLAGMAAVAYLMGPDPGNAYMAFRGSTTLAGTSAAIFVAIALAALDGWQRFVGLLLALYLNFIATSRTGLLLLFLLSAVVVSTVARKGKVVLDLALLSVCATVVILPAIFSTYYPYASSRPAPEGAHIEYMDRRLTDGEGLVQRYARLLRLARVVPADLPLSEIQRLEGEGAGDSRWVLFPKSLQAVAASPWGSWPQAFERQTQIYCGRPPICRYPHNLALEIGYHFGWLPFCIVMLGLAVLAVRVVVGLIQSHLIVRVASLAFLGHLGFAMFSGNLIDHTLALALGVVWTAAQALFHTPGTRQPVIHPDMTAGTS